MFKLCNPSIMISSQNHKNSIKTYLIMLHVLRCLFRLILTSVLMFYYYFYLKHLLMSPAWNFSAFFFVLFKPKMQCFICSPIYFMLWKYLVSSLCFFKSKHGPFVVSLFVSSYFLIIFYFECSSSCEVFYYLSNFGDKIHPLNISMLVHS